jgi:hypothetical protein
LSVVEERIGTETLDRYQEVLLHAAWHWTEEYFTLTPQDVQQLNAEGVPDWIVTRLTPLKDRRFPTETQFLEEGIGDYVGNEAAYTYRDLFVRYGARPVESVTEVRSNTRLIKQERISNGFTEYLASLPD